MAVVDISQVKISTVSVEVRTLSLNKKQMTLSFFRQIPERELLDFENGQLNGVPWGRINYFWQDHSSYDIHVIWQKNNEIFRDIICTKDRNNECERDITRCFHKIQSLKLKSAEKQKQLIEGCSWVKTYIPEIEAEIVRVTKEMEADKLWLAKHNKILPLIKDIESLPQLFIAV